MISTMANYWVREKNWDITVATLDDGARPLHYTMDPRVRYEPLGIARHSSKLVKHVSDTRRSIKVLKESSIVENLSTFAGRILHTKRRARLLAQYFVAKSPDLVISFITETNIVALLAGLRTGLPVIVSERNNPAYQVPDYLTRRLRRRLYPRATAVVCQTQGIVEFFLLGVSKNGVVIPNPVIPAGDDDSADPEFALPEGNLLFAIGGMARQKIYQKGFDLLLPVFDNLAKKHKDWSLVILGDGSERDALQRKAEECGLSGRVWLPGNVKNVHSLLAKGDLFVLSSRYEGFPNALCEAMASGLGVVSFDCPTGPRDIIRHGVDGLLVPPEDAPALEKGLDGLMSDREMREQMGARAREVVDRFSLERVMGMWEELVYCCMNEG